MPLLNATLVPGPDQVVVRFTGDADLSTAPFVADVLAQAGGVGTRQVVVDLGSARFWDCSGLHAIAGFTKELAMADRACRIVGAQPHTRRLIGMANLAADLELDGVATTPVRSAAPVVSEPSPADAPLTGGLVAAGR